jgi:transposase InsO family protein
LGWVQEAVDQGARQKQACAVAGIDARSLQRWREQGVGEDRRAGPHQAPPNKLSAAEREEVLHTANLPEHRDLSPKQIVPKLADQGRYLASESTFYRVLRSEGQLKHREHSRPATQRRPRELMARGPNQVWSWDITYLRAQLRGTYFYLYLVLDIFSRKIVSWCVEAVESADFARDLIAQACSREGIQAQQLSLHQDNGAPMKCGTFLALLQRLGVAASFSRPGVSDDNPYVEALFRTFKYRPEYPDAPFASLEAAREFVACFVNWYNHEHRHSNIRFVTPAQRHSGEEQAVLAQRTQVYERARARHPQRWSRQTRDWQPIQTVVLNPEVTHTAGAKA